MKVFRFLLLSIPVALWAQSSNPAATPIGAEDKARIHVHRIFSPAAFLGAAAGGGYEQLLGNPYEWGGGAQGYARRFGSSFGFNAAKQVVGLGLDTALREDPRYFPTGRQGFKQRVIHAALQAVICRTDSGTTVFAFSRVGSAFAAGGISRVWQPDRRQTAGQALESGFISIGLDAGTDVFREFWPDVRKRVFRK